MKINKAYIQKQINNFAKNILIVGVFAVFSLLSAKSITLNDNDTKIAVGEKIQLLTDRDLYAVQELVYFNAIYTRTNELQELNWSKVLYVELLNQDGQVELQQKLPLKDKGAFGSLKLPKELVTGYYYLRAYTKWMTNFGPQSFSYAKIIVVNPFDEQVYSSQNTNKDEIVSLKDTPNYMLTTLFSIQTDKASYLKRGKVRLKINLNESLKENRNYTVSVVKTHTLDSILMAGSINTKQQCAPLDLNLIKNLPENRGVSFTGSMNYTDGGSAKSGEIVNLSIIGDNPYFAQTFADDGGQFSFTLPKQHGELNLFLCPAGNEKTDVTFKVNSGFANFHHPITTEVFELSQVQREQAKELTINSQISNAFPKPDIEFEFKDSSRQADTLPVYFYGTPEHRLILDEYIVLPNLGEVFFELVPDVLLLKKKKINYLEVTNDIYWSSSLPLVLLDHIPIYDLSTILGIQSQKFEYIDVINTNYLKGGMLYCGIISIFSRNNDIAGAELPKGGAFFNYNAYDEQKQTLILGQTQEEKNIPDLRNCLYWNPSYSPMIGKNNEIEFYTSDNTGEYTVLIRTISGDGTHTELSSCKFSVE